jgi:hypothetical protein
LEWSKNNKISIQANLQSEVHGGDITWTGQGTLTIQKVLQDDNLDSKKIS